MKIERGRPKIWWRKKKPYFELVTVLKDGNETIELFSYKQLIDKCFDVLVEEIYKIKRRKKK